MPQIKVQTVPVGPMGMNCYLAENADTHETLVIDPGADGEEILHRLGSRPPVAVLLTHGHFDHIGGVDEVCEHFGIPLYMHEGDVPKLTDPYLNVSEQFGERVTVRTVPVPLADGQELLLGGMRVWVLHTPGHSRGSCCYLLEEDQCLFCGDTLFNCGYGRTDFPDGDFMAIKESLRKLFQLSPRRPAYPGHGAATYAGRDREGEK